MAPRKKKPFTEKDRERLARARRRRKATPLSLRQGNNMPQGFNRFGAPITCGVITKFGTECPQPVAGGLGTACVQHDPVLWRENLDQKVARGFLDQEEADRLWDEVHGNRKGG